MYLQRAVPDAAAETAGLWTPAVLQRAGKVPAASARYIVVDDLGDEAGVAVTVESSWPSVDTAGRLTFSEEGSERARPVKNLTSHVHVQRFEHDQDAADRPLRVGDTFYVEEIDGEWITAIDVTADARDSAKSAFYSAITPPVTGVAVVASREHPDETIPDEVASSYRGPAAGPAV